MCVISFSQHLSDYNDKVILKKKKNGSYCTRLVAMGFHQIARVDYQDNFAPVVNKTT